MLRLIFVLPVLLSATAFARMKLPAAAAQATSQIQCSLWGDDGRSVGDVLVYQDGQQPIALAFNMLAVELGDSPLQLRGEEITVATKADPKAEVKLNLREGTLTIPGSTLVIRVKSCREQSLR